MEYMIRFTQVHESFRLAEIKALAVLEGIALELVSYSPDVSTVPKYLIMLSHTNRLPSASSSYLQRKPQSN
jgi:tRNA G10  N-methylase Trm11